jgi:nitrite reductase/ring-hydroxylating ferredoxin subunit
MLSFRPHIRSKLIQLRRPRSTNINVTHWARFHQNTPKAMAQEFKLKDLTSIDLQNGQKLEAEVEGIEEGKVLLVKVKDELHALSPKCTHYGAPMKLGVVTGEGRLTCAWHGGGDF